MSRFTQTGSAKVVPGKAVTGKYKKPKKKPKDVMLPEDRKLIEESRKAGLTDKQIREKLEATPKFTPAPVSQAVTEAGGKTKITPEMGLPMPGEKTATTEAVTKGPAKGWQNVIDVMKIALNPFSTEGIVATSGNKTFNSVVEFVANHPYTAALAGTGVFAGLKALTGKFAVGTVAEYATIGGTVANTATAKATGNLLVKAGFSLIAAFYIVEKIAGTYPFAKFEIAETMQTLGMARWKAFEAGDTESMAAIDKFQDEILNPTAWEATLAKIPQANILLAAKQNIEAAELSRQVFNKLIQDEQTAKENGEDETSKWARINEEKAAQEKTNIDYYNSERMKLLKWEQEAYEASRISTREADKKARNEDAAFWAAQEAKQKELEAADRKAIAEFWMAYRKQAQKINEDNRPSNLNFGFI